tara:strand:+ start:448 stop:807 length:360 start_codon:yes stop_codon:yes gene_type:complete
MNPLRFNHLPFNVPLLRLIPIIDKAKLRSIKGITNKKNPNTHPPPPETTFMSSFIRIVVIKPIDAEMIEITPKTLEAIVLGECTFFGIGGGASFVSIQNSNISHENNQIQDHRLFLGDY